MHDTVPEIADERSHAVESVTCSQGKGKLSNSRGGGKVIRAWASGFGCSCSKVRYSSKKSAIMDAAIPVFPAKL